MEWRNEVEWKETTLENLEPVFVVAVKAVGWCGHNSTVTKRVGKMPKNSILRASIVHQFHNYCENEIFHLLSNNNSNNNWYLNTTTLASKTSLSHQYAQVVSQIFRSRYSQSQNVNLL